MIMSSRGEVLPSFLPASGVPQLLYHLVFWKAAFTVSFIVQGRPSLCRLALLLVLKFDIGILVERSITWLLKQR